MPARELRYRRAERQREICTTRPCLPARTRAQSTWPSSTWTSATRTRPRSPTSKATFSSSCTTRKSSRALFFWGGGAQGSWRPRVRLGSRLFWATEDAAWTTCAGRLVNPGSGTTRSCAPSYLKPTRWKPCARALTLCARPSPLPLRSDRYVRRRWRRPGGPPRLADPHTARVRCWRTHISRLPTPTEGTTL